MEIKRPRGEHAYPIAFDLDPALDSEVRTIMSHKEKTKNVHMAAKQYLRHAYKDQIEASEWVYRKSKANYFIKKAGERMKDATGLSPVPEGAGDEDEEMVDVNAVADADDEDEEGKPLAFWHTLGFFDKWVQPIGVDEDSEDPRPVRPSTSTKRKRSEGEVEAVGRETERPKRRASTGKISDKLKFWK